MRVKTLFPLAAAGITIATAVTWLARDKRTKREAFPDYSAYNTGLDGLSLARAYLKEREGAGKVSTLTRTVGRAGLEADAVILRVRPTESTFRTKRDMDPPDADEDNEKEKKKGGLVGWVRSLFGTSAPKRTDYLTPEEVAWVTGGGRLIIAADRDYEAIEVEAGERGRVDKVYPAFAGVETIMPRVRRRLAGTPLKEMHTVFALGEGPLIARRRIGDGDVIVMACPEIFQNRVLGKADHLALLDALGGTGRHVYFDEYVHGMASRIGALEIVRGWGFGALVVIGALACVAAFVRVRRRIGPPEDDFRDTRTEAVDFVDSLAELYGRALRRIEALALYEESFRRAAAVSTGIRGKALDARVASLTKGLNVPTNLSAALAASDRRVRDMSVQEFNRYLRGLNQAFGRLEHAKR
jgi:hypothetical protein